MSVARCLCRTLSFARRMLSFARRMLTLHDACDAVALGRQRMRASLCRCSARVSSRWAANTSHSTSCGASRTRLCAKISCSSTTNTFRSLRSHASLRTTRRMERRPTGLPGQRHAVGRCVRRVGVNHATRNMHQCNMTACNMHPFHEVAECSVRSATCKDTSAARAQLRDAGFRVHVRVSRA